MEEHDKTDILEQALDDAALFAYISGNVREALNITQFIRETYPENENAQTLYGQITLSMSMVYDKLTDERKEETDRIGHLPPNIQTHTEHNYKLCQQTDTQYKGDPNLFCMYDFFNGENGMWNWNPIQIELLSASLGIIKVHNALNKQTISLLKQAARPKVIDLGHSTSKEPESFGQAIEQLEIKNRHVSLSPKHMPRALVKRLESMLGSALTEESPLQISNFAIGADIEQCEDISQLTSPEEGGATLFPDAGLTVYPETGSMLIWMEATQTETTVTNSECPVIIGDKWTGTYRCLI